MYNPASILHSITKVIQTPFPWGGTEGESQQDVPHPPSERAGLGILTLGTNHVYIERATGDIVDNCQKRPASDFEERSLSVDECADYLRRSIELLHEWNPEMKIILTVSPIRYRKYGYHESQLSKATLLMAVDEVTGYQGDKVTDCQEDVTLLPCYSDNLMYFPSYEILLDELRDYRFYAPDMLHPSEQAVDYIYRRFQDCFFSVEARQFVNEWRPIREALAHRPFHPDSPEYQSFRDQTLQRQHAFEQKWNKRER